MIKVLNSGLFSSIQDLGRFGYRDQGVPLSGAMDQYASVFANQLLGNSPKAAVLEFALQGPSLLFHKDCMIAISGGEWLIEVDGKKVGLYQPIRIKSGSSLKCLQAKSGMFGYLAISGGFQTPEVLGSRSYYQGVTEESKITKGQRLNFSTNQVNQLQANSSIVFDKTHLQCKQIEVYPAAEFHQLSAAQKKQLVQGNFKVSKNSNRMAFQLEHQLELKAGEISTAPVEAGTVQLTPSGQLIILMRDAQTTGGYARVLQLSPSAINRLAQKRPGAEISFSLKQA